MILFLSYDGISYSIFDRIVEAKVFYCINDRGRSTIESWRPHIDKAKLVVADSPTFSLKLGAFEGSKALLIGLHPFMPNLFASQGHWMYEAKLPTRPSQDNNRFVWAILNGSSFLSKCRDISGECTRESRSAGALIETLLDATKMHGYVGPFGIWYQKRWGQRYINRLDESLAFTQLARFIDARNETPEYLFAKMANGALIE